MKVVFALCALALICIAQASGEGCEPGKVWTDDNCAQFTCSSDGKSITGKTCPEALCPPGKLDRYEEDKTKQYPYCCPIPICKD